jgi:hypothetical protein
LGGKVVGTLSIDKLTNVNGQITPHTGTGIVLQGNNTGFGGNADININGKPTFKDVPVVVYLLNGKLVNFTISANKTNGLFPFPLFGIVTSLTH